MFPQEMIPQMFSNIKSIYQFHHDFLLPQLEDRMSKWDQESKISKLLELHCCLVVTKLKNYNFLFKEQQFCQLDEIYIPVECEIFWA